MLLAMSFFACAVENRHGELQARALNLAERRGRAPPAGKTPFKGYNSWDFFRRGLNETGALATAETMRKYLLPYGFDTLVIDGGWSTTYSNGTCTVNDGCIDEFGRAQPDPVKWPSSAGGKGLGPFVAKVHKMGLRVGVHVMRGALSLAAINARSPVRGGSGVTVDQLNTSKCGFAIYWSVDMRKPASQLFLDSIYDQYAEWGLVSQIHAHSSHSRIIRWVPRGTTRISSRTTAFTRLT